jgi:hypothetical protein
VRRLTPYPYDPGTGIVLDRQAQRCDRTDTTVVVVTTCSGHVPSSLVMVNLRDFQCGAISG